jgi:ATP-dependent Clp protease ATP-binding subunit ClpA
MFFKRLIFVATLLTINCYSHAKTINRADYSEKLNQLIQETDSETYREILAELSQTPTYEFRKALVDKLDNIMLLSRDEVVEDLHEMTKIISETVKLFMRIGSKDNVHMLGQMIEWLDHNVDNKVLTEEIFQTILHIGDIPYLELPSIDESIQDQSRALVAIDHSQNKRVYELALRRAEDLLADMQAKVIEQDEILKVLQALFIEDTISDGQRLSPEILYLMGLPGIGKDTIAEAYVDALWQQSGAHKDHMFRMNIRNKAEIWSYLGSAKGYVGSGDLPAFLRFLVEHSGGKYLTKVVQNAKGDEQTIIEKNPEWNGTYVGTKPHRAVVFVNESHNIPKEVKDNILKQAIERGIFPINNPGSTPNSVDHLEIPVTFVFASNEGISLLEPREKNGARMGEPLSYEELLENYYRVKDDKQKLKQAILNHNGEKNDPVADGAPGTSEEFLSRIPSSRIHLLKPISPDGLRRITRLFEAALTARLREAVGPMGQFDIRLSEELVEFLISYNYIASDGARPLKDRLESFVFEPFYESIINRRIRPSGQNLTIDIGLREYNNNARSLQFNVFEGDREYIQEDSDPSYSFTRLIAQTLKDRPQAALSDEEVQELVALRERITSQVFGVEHIVDRLIEAVITSESESRNMEANRSATVMAFLGKTSTGKTETAKQYVKARYGEDQLPTVIDFNGIRDLQSMKAKILGTVDSRNNPIASDFMKAYDRANGRIAFIFDEAANAPKELLKGLYEILRESTVTGFSDGKPRKMRNVSIILTGNAGEEIYQNISPDLSTRRYAQAMEEVFKLFVRNEALQTRILTQTFPEALLARIGRNIFHFGPLSNKSRRQIAQLKLLQGLKRLLPKPSERGWHVQFASEKDLLDMFHMIEIEGYNQAYQGASIDKFVKEAIIDAVKTKLLTSGFRNDSQVVLSVGELVAPKDGNTPPYRVLTLTSESGREIEVQVELQRQIKDLPQNINQRLLVTFHEVGHEIVSHYFFHEVLEPSLLKILPGVSIIDGELVSYAGIRGGIQNQQIEPTKEMVLRRAAVLTGGYMAEQIVTIGNRHGAGKSNDIKRATAYIQQAILQWGLSERWDRQAIPPNTSISDYIDKHLSEREKERLHEITQDWLSRAEQMARTAIISNLHGAFFNLSQELARVGDLNGDQINEIYARSGFVFNASQAIQENYDPRQVYRDLESMLSSNKDRLLEKYSLDNVLNDPLFYENAFNDLSSWSTGLLGRMLRRSTTWTSLSRHEQMMAQVIISGFFEDQNLTPRMSDEVWQFSEVIDPDAVLREREEAEKEGVIEMENFELQSEQPTAIEYTSEEVDLEETSEPTTHTGSLTCRSILSPR